MLSPKHRVDGCKLTANVHETVSNISLSGFVLGFLLCKKKDGNAETVSEGGITGAF